MNKLLWIFSLVMVVALGSCSGKRNESVRADRPDTVVLKAGPDSILAVVGSASTADRLQLVLKFQHEFPDTVSVTLPDALRLQGDKEKSVEKATFAVGRVVKAVISREESGEYALHALTDVTEPFVKACDRYMGTWITPDSLALTLTVAKGGVASAGHSPKLHYSEWRFRNFDFSAILLTGEGNVCDTAMVADGKLTLHSKQGKGVVKIVTFVRQKQKDK